MTRSMVEQRHIPVDHERIASFCRKWLITEFALFGSILRDDFRTDSDVDVLVKFSPESHWSLIDVIEMTEGLETMFGHKVDLVEEEAIRNPFRRKSILGSKEVVYSSLS